MNYTLHRGNCLTVLRTMADNSVDSIVTDPPYGLTTNKKGGSGVASVNLESPYGRARIGTGNGPGGFMGHKWDSDVPAVEVWAECLRVLKPGGYLLAFAGTRTQHRMATRIEDAGFEIRDMIAWVYGSGFPKSHNGEWGGTALKPALEPITMARKPLVGTVAENWRAHGTGALNIDGSRVKTDDDLNGGAYAETGGRSVSGSLSASGMNVPGKTVGAEFVQPAGRWPANLIHDGSEEVLAAFPEAPGQMADASTNADQRKTQNVYGAMRRGRGDEPSADSENSGAVGFKMKPGARRLDAGSAARFFYCAKASRADRNEGLFSSSTPAVGTGATMREREIADWPARNGNFHPTVKPIALMAYLIRLVTPPRGTTLDCYMGSGSTGVAAMREGFNFIGIERDEDENGKPLGYMDIARARIEYELHKPKQNQLDLEAA